MNCNKIIYITTVSTKFSYFIILDSTPRSVVVDLAVVCNVTHASLLNVDLIEGIEDFIIQYDCYDKNGTKVSAWFTTNLQCFALQCFALQ